MLAHIATISGGPKAPSNVELWQKLQLVLVKAFEIRHDEFEYEEHGQNTPLPLQKDSIMVLANVMIATG